MVKHRDRFYLDEVRLNNFSPKKDGDFSPPIFSYSVTRLYCFCLPFLGIFTSSTASLPASTSWRHRELIFCVERSASASWISLAVIGLMARISSRCALIGSFASWVLLGLELRWAFRLSSFSSSAVAWLVSSSFTLALITALKNSRLVIIFSFHRRIGRHPFYLSFGFPLDIVYYIRFLENVNTFFKKIFENIF